MSDIHAPTEQEIDEAVSTVPFMEVLKPEAMNDVASNTRILTLVSSLAAHIWDMAGRRRVSLHIAIISGLASMFEVGMLVGIQIGRKRQVRDQQQRPQ